MEKMFLLAGLILFLASSGFAQEDYAGRFALDLGAAYYDPAEEGVDSEFGPSIAIKCFGEENAALTLSLAFFEWKTKEEISDVANGIPFEVGLKGKVKIIPLALTAEYFLPPINKRLRPYIGGGIDYYFINTDVKGTMTGAGLTYDLSYNIDDTLGFHVVCGLELTLAEKFLLDLRLRYVWCEPDDTFSVSGPIVESIADEVDADGPMIELRVRSLF